MSGTHEIWALGQDMSWRVGADQPSCLRTNRMDSAHPQQGLNHRHKLEKHIVGPTESGCGLQARVGSVACWQKRNRCDPHFISVMIPSIHDATHHSEQHLQIKLRTKYRICKDVRSVACSCACTVLCSDPHCSHTHRTVFFSCKAVSLRPASNQVIHAESHEDWL